MTDDTDKGAEPGVDRVLYGSSPPTPAASSAGASSPAIPANMASVDWCGLGKGRKGGALSKSGPQPPRPSATSTSIVGGSAPVSSQSLCRPWDRGDLLKRLSTFKSSNWSSTPKVFGPLACARRGWMNVDGDMIACEACGARLSFPTPASWSQHQVELAAESYAEQLDIGHKALCPWKGNSCAESLAQFPPSPVSALIGGFDDRCDALLQFSSLPVISGSAIDKMKLTRGPEIDRLLARPPPSMGRETGKRVEDGSVNRHGSMDPGSNPYYQAQRLISLCGWEPRFLPNIVDCEEHSAHTTRKGQSVNPGEGPSHRMCEPSIVLVSGSGRLDKRASGHMMESDLKCGPASAVLDCSLCGASVGLWNYTTVVRPSPLMPPGSLELPEPPQKYIGAPVHGASAASVVEGWHMVEMPSKEKDLREEAGDATVVGEQKLSSHSGTLDQKLTITGGSTPTILGFNTVDILSAEPAMDSQQFVGQPEGSEMGGPVASYESFGPGFRRHRMDDGGSTVDRPQSRMHHTDSIEGTVVDLEGDEVDGGEAGRTRSYVGESSKRKRGGESSAADQVSYGYAITDPGCSNFVPAEADFEVDNTDRFKKNRREALFQELYDQRILLAQPAGDSVCTYSVIAVDTSYSKQENSMESVENLPQDSDAQETAFSWDKSERLDNEDLNVLEQAQQSTCHQRNVGEVNDGLLEPGISTSDEVVENDAPVFSPNIGMGCGLSVGMSGGSVQMGASHEAEIHGADLSVHRMESIANDAELITEVTELRRQTSESVPGQVLTGQFALDAEQTNAHKNTVDSHEAVHSLSVAKVYSGIKQDESGQAESWDTEQKGHQVGLADLTKDANVNNAMMQASALGKEEHTADEVLTEPLIRGSGSIAANGRGKRPGNRRSRKPAGEFDPILQHYHYCPWIDGHVAAAGTRESNLRIPVCGWQLTIDALDKFNVQNHTFAAPVESESAASMHKGID